MSILSDLETARENLAQELRIETAARLADQAAGKGVKTTYSANGRSVDWLGYLRAMTDAIKALDDAIEDEEGPFEHVTQAWTG